MRGREADRRGRDRKNKEKGKIKGKDRGGEGTKGQRKIEKNKRLA